MKIASFETKEEDKKFFESELKEHHLLFFEEPLTQDILEKIREVEILSIFIGSKITKNILDALPGLKFIATRSTGFDHIDLEECKKRGIKVSNVPTYGTDSVAEHTFALILALAKRLPESLERTKKGVFSCENLTGIELKGKTLGIIGAGRIGRRVAEIAKAFGMKVIAYDPYHNDEEAKRIGYTYVDLDTLLQESDIITLHANLTRENYHMLGNKEFELMKPGIIIINTARGALIDSTALLKALKENKVAYAGLDVLEEEGEIREELSVLYKKEEDVEMLKRILADNLLIRMENESYKVIITPHNAFNAKEALQRIRQTTVENIKSFIQDEPKNLVG